MKIENLEVNNGLIMLDSTEDSIENCKLERTDIVSLVPTLYTRCVIKTKQELHYQDIDLKKPHAKVVACHLTNCGALSGKFSGNIIEFITSEVDR